MGLRNKPFSYLKLCTGSLISSLVLWQSRMLLQPELVLEDVSQDHARKTVRYSISIDYGRTHTHTQTHAHTYRICYNLC